MTLRAIVVIAFIVFTAVLTCSPIISPAYAANDDTDFSAEQPKPPSLGELQSIEPSNRIINDEGNGLPLDIRLDALKEAAMSYGARAGLANRTFEIRRQTASREPYLDEIFDFNQLLIPAPSGFLIEPPIISESINAVLIDTDGQTAAVSDRILNIVNNAQIVSGPRNWRTYLEREWGSVESPPDILLPQNDEERATWIENINIGWEQGFAQADEIFEEDLNVLSADYQGMVRYRMLLAQGMISPPYALQTDRGVTGGGNEMRIGDRAVQITGVPRLMTGTNTWQPASR